MDALKRKTASSLGRCRLGRALMAWRSGRMRRLSICRPPRRSSGRCSRRAENRVDRSGRRQAGVYMAAILKVSASRVMRPNIIYRTQGAFVTEAVVKAEADLAVTSPARSDQQGRQDRRPVAQRGSMPTNYAARRFRSAPPLRRWRRRSCRSSRRRLLTRRSARSVSKPLSR